MSKKKLNIIIPVIISALLGVNLVLPVFVGAAKAQSSVYLTATVVATVLPACNDTVDNDGDSKTDYPADPGCSSITDNDETDPAPSSSGGGGGGGGGAVNVPITTVIFNGRAYPKSSVTLLKDAQVAASTVAGQDANFEISLSTISAGNYNFSLYSEDNKSRRSSLLTFPVTVTQGATTKVTGIFVAPTIAVDKSEVKRGDNIAVFGQSVPQSDIIISVNSDEEFFGKTIADKDGIYLYNFDTTALEYGSHLAKSKASIGNQLVSGYSQAVNFKVGAQNVKKLEQKVPAKGEVNNDGKVDLVDFSIVSYWYNRPLTEEVKQKVDLNADGKVDLTDLSILAYHWTG